MFENNQKKSDQAEDGKTTVKDERNLKQALDENIQLFKDIFKNDETVVFRQLQNKFLKAARCCLVYIDGMVNNEIINENIIGAFLCADLTMDIDEKDLIGELMQKVIVSNDVSAENDVSKAVNSVLYGDTLFLLDGFDRALVINTKGWQSRSVTEPEAAKVIRGPREGFTESIIVNLSLLRRKITSPDLKFKFRYIGTRTRTKTCICYIEGLAKDGIIKELEKRLDDINIDGILDSGYIQELIRDAPFSPFETVGSNERPDVTAGKLLEGRVALFVDGSPFVLTVPFIAAENFQANEDYYNNYIISSVNRFLRAITAMSTILIPALYLSIVTYHQEMLPTPLLLSIAAARQDVPLPTSVSLFIMLLIFDIMREATTRMPTNISQAIAIIGTIVLGQAAIEAKLVGAPVLIVTALTGITTLMTTSMIGAFVVFRYFTLLGTSLFGIYGALICTFMLYMHLMSIRSFGVPYMISITRFKNHDGQDAWIRAPWWTMTLRPKIIGARNLVRQVSARNKVK